MITTVSYAGPGKTTLIVLECPAAGGARKDLGTEGPGREDKDSAGEDPEVGRAWGNPWEPS